jgi:hypothetical protein
MGRSDGLSGFVVGLNPGTSANKRTGCQRTYWSHKSGGETSDSEGRNEAMTDRNKGWMLATSEKQGLEV